MSLICTDYSQIVNRENDDQINRFQDDILGISFVYIGTPARLDESTYSIKLLSNNSPVESAVAQISVSGKLFVDLPGSYGGKFYLDSSYSQIYRNRVMIDSFNTGNENFRREYWAVYAGMGMWDCVINCYKKKMNKYFIISLVQYKQVGKPGEIVEGKPLTSKDLRLEIVSSFKDPTNTIVKKFNELLSSFQIIN